MEAYLRAQFSLVKEPNVVRCLVRQNFERNSASMFKFAEQASWLTFNNDVEEAMNMVRPYMAVNPICAVQYLHASVLSLVITTKMNDTEAVEKILEVVGEADKLVQEIESSDERVIAFAKHNMELNARAENEPVVGYVPPLVETPVPKYSRQEVIKQYRLINQIMSGELHIIRGGMQFMTASYVRAVYNIRLGLKLVETLYEQTKKDPTVHENILACIKCGYGLFQYVLSIVPPGIQWLLNMIGFSGDRQLGLKLVREAADSEGRLAPVAILGLGAHYIVIGGGLKSRANKIEKYSPIIARAVERYPHGTPFQSFAGQVHRKKGDIDSAISAMETGLAWSNKKLHAEPRFISSELAQCYFLNQNYDKTCEIMEQVLLEKREFPGRSLSAWVLATTYSLQGKYQQRDKLLSTLESYYNLTKKNMPLERFVTSKNDTVKTILDPNARTLFLLVSYFELLYARDRLNELNHQPERYFVPLLTILKEKRVLMKGASADLSGACTFFEAVFEKRLGENVNTVKEKLYTIIDAEGKVEPQWIAFANFEIAEMLWNLPDRNPLAIERSLKAAQEAKNYASEDIMHSRLNSALRQVAKEKKKQLHHKKHHHHK